MTIRTAVAATATIAAVSLAALSRVALAPDPAPTATSGLYLRGDSTCVDRPSTLADPAAGLSMTICSKDGLALHGDTVEMLFPPQCDAGLNRYTRGTDVRGARVFTLDEAYAVDTLGVCRGVVVARRIGTAVRFVVTSPPCAGDTSQTWRLFATSYTTRTAAIDRAARPAPSCP